MTSASLLDQLLSGSAQDALSMHTFPLVQVRPCILCTAVRPAVAVPCCPLHASPHADRQCGNLTCWCYCWYGLQSMSAASCPEHGCQDLYLQASRRLDVAARRLLQAGDQQPLLWGPRVLQCAQQRCLHQEGAATSLLRVLQASRDLARMRHCSLLAGRVPVSTAAGTWLVRV